MSGRELWRTYDESRDEGGDLADFGRTDADDRPFLDLTLNDAGLEITVRLHEDAAEDLEDALRGWRLERIPA